MRYFIMAVLAIVVVLAVVVYYQASEEAAEDVANASFGNRASACRASIRSY